MERNWTQSKFPRQATPLDCTSRLVTAGHSRWLSRTSHSSCLRDAQLRFESNSPNSLAFQTGETIALLSSNYFEATPHFVNAASSTLSPAALARIRQQIEEDSNWANVTDGSVSRETLAVFIQVSFRHSVGLECALIRCSFQPNDDEFVSKTGETFGNFTKRVLQRHYDVE